MAKAIFVTRHGGPEVLEMGPHDPGQPGPGQARVRVAAAGVNFIDTYFRTGAYPVPVPFIDGVEGAGVVQAVGEGVDGLSPGDRVAWASARGSYATELLAPADVLVKIPETLDLEVAAAAMLQGMTAHYLTEGVRQTAQGDVALVHAAAGGTGQLLVQMLTRAGARVLATCSTEAKAELARKAGATDVILYEQSDFAEEARRLTDGRGVDVVYDSVGKSTFDRSLKALRPRGLLCLYGQASGPVEPFDLQRLNRGGSLFVTRPSLAHYTASKRELRQRAADVFGQIRSGTLQVRIDHRYELADASSAHRALEGRKTTGKVLLTVAG
ncbi:MAG: quinone oxidoreductase [Myxococcales bacterium]|nr:quinone oxidoreductase [Myxococcales bacterium]MDD9970632.1 quinone oxidoreductase [Myxococcales bacterium]